MLHLMVTINVTLYFAIKCYEMLLTLLIVFLQKHVTLNVTLF